MCLSRCRSARASRRALLACLLFSLLLCLPGTLFGQPAPPSTTTSRTEQAKEEWMGWYWDQRKIGYGSVRVAPITFQGRPALQETSLAVIKLTVLGASVETNEATVTVSDLQMRPLAQTFDVKSNGSALHVEAAFNYAAHKVACRIGSGASATTKTLSIPPGANLAGDSNYLTAGQKLAVGQKLSFYFLEPLTVTLQQATVEVTGQETIKDASNGKEVRAFVVKSALPEGQMTAWETADGDMLKGEMSLGFIRMTLVKESKEVALNPASAAPSAGTSGKANGAAYTPPTDFAVMTAITTDKPLDNPRRLRTLSVTISGIPEKQLILSDVRQQERIVSGTDDSAGYTVQADIHATPFAEAQSARLPVTDPALKPYLEKAAYLDTDDASLRATAAKLRGTSTNLYAIACRIRDWVHAQMTPDASIGVPRSATDIYHRRRGVCRDYATLYAALARAAGVPTRLCAGIVYAQGKFYYHAWAESYVGQWVAFDPTLYDPEQPVAYVDATHIKFAQGDVTGMFDVVAIVGKLQIRVQQFAL